MEEYQINLIKQMTVGIGLFKAQTITLEKLIDDLRGLFAAAEIKDRSASDGFGLLVSRLGMELELRVEPWAPKGLASDITLAKYIEDLEAWIRRTLAKAR